MNASITALVTASMTEVRNDNDHSEVTAAQPQNAKPSPAHSISQRPRCGLVSAMPAVSSAMIARATSARG